MPDADVKSIESGRHEISYRRSGSGAPLVLLHPLALSGEIWAPVASRLAAYFDVLAPDARGHGRTGWDGEPFGVDDLADDVCALLDALDLPAAHVVGMSMGGSTAVSLAGRYPSRVTAMALADTTAWYGEDAPQIWEDRARNVLAKPREQHVPFQTDRWFTETFRRHNARAVNDVVRIFLRTDSLAHAAACRALGTMDARSLLAAITAPVLVLAGTEDYATPPEMGRAIAEGVSRGQARTLPGLRHLSLVERPELASDIADFLNARRLPG